MNYVVLDALRNQKQASLRNQFAFDVLMGFSAKSKYLPSKYFYDARGSELFEQITDLEEYYPTRCEYEILERIGPEISAIFHDEAFDILELGAGDGRKTKLLLSYLLKADKEFSYMPIDISESAVAGLCGSLGETHPGLQTNGVVGDYFDSLRYVEHRSANRKLVLFLGSNIGNFDIPNALVFLRMIWKCLNDGDLLLLGFDLKKEIDVLLRAYNDTKGVTREFNLNMLDRINRELRGEFDSDRFAHYGLYNPARGAMESYLISMTNQEVYIGELEKTFNFDDHESIHLEFSYKYLLSDIERMAGDTGFRVLNIWRDSLNWFADALWQVRKEV
jgi:dimethylhistidine N-methyltransferase